MTSSSEHAPSIKNAKYITWLIVITIISIFLSGRINFWMPEYSHMDFVKYQVMADASPDFADDVIQPFAYRVGAPWIAGLLPFSSEMSFYILNTISLLLLAIVFYKFLVKNNIELRISFALSVCFVFNRYFFQFNGWNYFHLADVIALILLMIILFKSIKAEWAIVLPLMLFGVLIKESLLIVIPVLFVKLILDKSKMQNFIALAFISVLSVALFIGIRLVIGHQGGETLWEQFYSGLIHFLTPLSLSKKILIAFIPFGIIPFLFYKHSLSFFKENLHFAVLILCTFIISFFGDAERLMALASPAYFVLIGYIIQSHLHENSGKRQLKKLLTQLMIITFVSSFYHLWGIVELPSSLYSIISTVLTSSAVVYLFWKMKNLNIITPMKQTS